ncbi:acyltransferase family protein [Algibacter sp. 2305UL17-15]|uniref:acyltransferase n=1 Tax=Algibacter sp. 2305UL17-15 TaxID=3231268 RepID=UPI00345A468F
MNKKIDTLHKRFGISILRIIATFSVIIIHVSGPLVVKFGEISNYDWNVANFYDGISRYAVPMFFMISGALLLNKDYNLKVFLKKRLGKILPAFLIWSIFYSIFHRYILGSEVFNLNKVIKDVFYGSEYHLWFIYVLIGLYLITPILRKWIKNASQHEILYFIIIWVFTLILEIPGFKIFFPKIDFSYFTGYIGYFVLGYYLSQYKLKQNFLAILFVVLGFFITVFGTYFFTFKNMKFYYFFYEYLTLNTLLASAGLFVLFNEYTVINKRVKSIIHLLSKCCFGIYLIHPLVLDLLRLIDFDVSLFSPIFSILFVALICFIFSFLIISLFKKSKFGYVMS